MSENPHSVIVVRRGFDNQEPIEAGDPITAYELSEPWPFRDLPPHSGHTQELVEYHEAVMERSTAGDFRIEAQYTCRCASRRVIAQLLVHVPTARRWVTVKPEHVPAALRKGPAQVDGWPLHGAPGEAPHVGAVASCKQCSRLWLVVTFVDEVRTVALASATHGGHIVP